MQPSTPLAQHQWLQQFLGDWRVEADCVMGPDQPPMKSFGTEHVRSLGGLWIIGEGSNDHCTTVLTIGYDPKIERFVGSFVASVMTMQWKYEGTLNESGTILTLATNGPRVTGDGYADYEDIYEIVNADCRKLRSRLKLPNGEWMEFMNATYTRVHTADAPSIVTSSPIVATTVTTYLDFAGKADEAIAFYREHLGAKLEMLMRFNQSPESPPPGMLQPGFEEKVMHASITIGNTRVMLSDGCDDKSKFEAARLSMTAATEAEAHRMFNALADGGTVIMPLAKTFWSPLFGMVTDRFGLGWMISLAS